MNPSLEQDNFPEAGQQPTVFSSDPAGVKEKPSNALYRAGVEVNYTSPAKWWNWLFNHISNWLKVSKEDRTNIKTELINTLNAGNVVPNAAVTNQLNKAVQKIAYDTCIAHDANGNAPYVEGYTLYLPETELL